MDIRSHTNADELDNISGNSQHPETTRCPAPLAPARSSGSYIPPAILRRMKAEAEARAAGLSTAAEEAISPEAAAAAAKAKEEQEAIEDEEIRRRNEKHICMTIQDDLVQRQHTFALSELSNLQEEVEVWEENGTMVWGPFTPETMLSTAMRNSFKEPASLEEGMNPPMRKKKKSVVRFVRAPSVDFFKSEDFAQVLEQHSNIYSDDDDDSPSVDTARSNVEFNASENIEPNAFENVDPTVSEYIVPTIPKNVLPPSHKNVQATNSDDVVLDLTASVKSVFSIQTIASTSEKVCVSPKMYTASFSIFKPTSSAPYPIPRVSKNFFSIENTIETSSSCCHRFDNSGKSSSEELFFATGMHALSI
mmetsp:Transcript_8769/g.11889  ORF Transcript_8769/g.11889 Transcript_8769/m.11889 type:complete len:363 (+) Transcript_8769:131-1219(+)|eukprot:CAMPEP_0196572576 /NCGR_PEP_ID=MMETSP1081-20130531/2601_1 /TAXON_ID=36882 /ORGANISM="Pyramimonas amylifera, Strain CCMP720" /LENGTH=362 /DNA_ID=CAMNT_0041889937 /DNA_START=170 /DNA_END=1258 /DNA_ORIENTATION=-